MLVVGEAASEAEALALASTLRPDVVVVGAKRLTSRSLQTVSRLSASHHRCRVIVWSEWEEETSMVEALREGASGCLVWGRSQPSEVAEVIHTVARGGSVISPGLAGCILDEVRGEGHQ